MRLHVVADRFDLDAVALTESHPQFKRVDRIEPKPLPEKRFLAVDFLGLNVLEFEGVDDKLLNFQFKIRHDQAFPRNTAQ